MPGELLVASRSFRVHIAATDLHPRIHHLQPDGDLRQLPNSSMTCPWRTKWVREGLAALLQRFDLISTRRSEASLCVRVRTVLKEFVTMSHTAGDIVTTRPFIKRPPQKRHLLCFSFQPIPSACISETHLESTSSWTVGNQSDLS